MLRSNRPIVERLPHIAIKDIAKLIPRHNPNMTINPDCYNWRYPGKVSLTMHSIKITDAAIVPQCFRLAWIKTGMGKQRTLIVCQCIEIPRYCTSTMAVMLVADAIRPTTNVSVSAKPAPSYGKPPDFACN
jgi:hypothetical protein